MYYIYHIKGIKIGCTTDLAERVEKKQGYTNYEILYTTNNIHEASKKELELQTKYEYKQDKKPYKEIIMNIKNKFYITDKTVTLNNTFDKELTDFEFPDYITYDNKKIYFTENLIAWIKGNNIKSQNDNCIESAYNVISDRTGKMINGTFVKDVPELFPGTLEELDDLLKIK